MSLLCIVNNERVKVMRQQIPLYVGLGVLRDAHLPDRLLQPLAVGPPPSILNKRYRHHPFFSDFLFGRLPHVTLLSGTRCELYWMLLYAINSTDRSPTPGCCPSTLSSIQMIYRQNGSINSHPHGEFLVPAIAPSAKHSRRKSSSACTPVIGPPLVLMLRLAN